MDINLSGITHVLAINEPGAGLHVRDEDGYYAQFGTEWPPLAWATQVVARIVRLRLAIPVAGHTMRLAHS